MSTPLTSIELQMLETLQRKQLNALRNSPTLNQQAINQPYLQNQSLIPPTPQPSFDVNSLNTIIDQKVAERVGALAANIPQQQQAQPTLQQMASPQTIQAKQPEQPVLQLKSQDKAFLDRLRPLFMGALTLEQKGRLAELAFAVHTQSNSTEQAYRVGFDAFCEFMATSTGREWIQVGTNAFLQALEPQTSVPSSIDVKTK